MKRNIIFIFAMMVVVMILVVSHTPLEVVPLLGLMLVMFIVPGIKRLLIKDDFRKVKAAFYTAIIFTLGLYIFYVFASLFDGWISGDLFLSMVMVFLFSLIGNFLYGIPVSVMAEIISMKFMGKRVWVSGLIHIGFGAVTYFYHPGFSLAAVCCSVLFFLLDERIRRNY